MPYLHEHSARIESPKKYIRFRRENDAFGPGVDVIWGITKSGKAEVQAIRYDANIWTTKQAKENAQENWSILKFEPAKRFYTIKKNPQRTDYYEKWSKLDGRQVVEIIHVVEELLIKHSEKRAAIELANYYDISNKYAEWIIKYYKNTISKWL